MLTGNSRITRSYRYQPEDMRALTSRLDDILGAIEETAFRLSAYRFAWLVAAIPESCLRLKACADGIHSALDGIAQRDGLRAKYLDITLFSSRDDESLRESARDLFSSDFEALTVFTNHEICNALDQTFLFCKSTVEQLLILESSCA